MKWEKYSDPLNISHHHVRERRRNFSLRENTAYFRKVSEVSSKSVYRQIPAFGTRYSLTNHVCHPCKIGSKMTCVNQIELNKNKGGIMCSLPNRRRAQKYVYMSTGSQVKYADVLDDVAELDDVFASEKCDQSDQKHDVTIKGNNLICNMLNNKSFTRGKSENNYRIYQNAFKTNLR